MVGGREPGLSAADAFPGPLSFPSFHAGHLLSPEGPCIPSGAQRALGEGQQVPPPAASLQAPPHLFRPSPLEYSPRGQGFVVLCTVPRQRPAHSGHSFYSGNERANVTAGPLLFMVHGPPSVAADTFRDRASVGPSVARCRWASATHPLRLRDFLPLLYRSCPSSAARPQTAARVAQATAVHSPRPGPGSEGGVRARPSARRVLTWERRETGRALRVFS